MFTRAGVSPLREFALRAHPTIPSGRSPRYRTAGVTSLRGDTLALDASSAVHAEARSVIPSAPLVIPSEAKESIAAKEPRAARLLPAILLILAVACSRPGSWEQFVRAEDAAEGVYEFALPFPAAADSPELSASSDAAATYDLSFYTAPLAEPLQMEVTWLYSTAEVFPVSQKHGHQEQKPREIVPGPPSDRDTGNTLIAPVFSETVWFPAGQHRALYRSGIMIPTGDLPQKEAKTWKVIVKPINPPEDFRGLGIICKKNDGTR